MKLTDFEWVTKHEIAALLCCSTKTIDRYRKGERQCDAPWQNNAHYLYCGLTRQFKYNKQLLIAWSNRKLAPQQYLSMLQVFVQATQKSA